MYVYVEATAVYQTISQSLQGSLIMAQQEKRTQGAKNQRRTKETVAP